MKSVLIVINVDSQIDLITNSSSELFVMRGTAKEGVEEVIEELYPQYLSEYEKVKNISELTTQELDTYFTYHCNPNFWPATKKSDYPLLPGFTFEELYEEDRTFGDLYGYKLRQNENCSFVTDGNREEMIEKLCPNKDMYFLYSQDENPDWERQEDLMKVGIRYHLG